jgi:hypothetical protein
MLKHCIMQCPSNFFFVPTAHPTLTVACEGTHQNFALQKGGTEQYVGTKNADPICKS